MAVPPAGRPDAAFARLRGDRAGGEWDAPTEGRDAPRWRRQANDTTRAATAAYAPGASPGSVPRAIGIRIMLPHSTHEPS